MLYGFITLQYNITNCLSETFLDSSIDSLDEIIATEGYNSL